ncbi:MAG: phosphoribosylglycinamide formyltransferase, partial [Bacillota bacterium]
DYEAAMIEVLTAHQVELVVLAGFMKVLSAYFVNHYPEQIMNIHPSLLPAFPGPNAQQQALDYGVKVSGCTVHFVDTGLDTGPIINQAAVPVLEEDTVTSLAERILKVEHQIYAEAIQLFAEGRLEVEADRVKILE